MWDLLQVILKKNVTPNQVLLLFGMKKGVSVSPKNTRADDKQHLISIGYLEEMNGVYKLTPEAKAFLVRLDNYFIKAKKKTDIQLMGKDFVDKINKYRETFPAKKLPSGKPARNNVKALGEAFRWFFETYDYSWDEIHKATSMYVNEYRDKDYLYMQTSQYFISKQDKHKVKHSTLADYCDMILEGVSTEEDHFKENVV
tara:strand:- start:579 stop:1175 length:597 start_codon:yes stop_codon:yes gene_type:complete